MSPFLVTCFTSLVCGMCVYYVTLSGDLLYKSCRRGVCVLCHPFCASLVGVCVCVCVYDPDLLTVMLVSPDAVSRVTASDWPCWLSCRRSVPTSPVYSVIGNSVYHQVNIVWQQSLSYNRLHLSHIEDFSSTSTSLSGILYFVVIIPLCSYFRNCKRDRKANKPRR